MGWIRNNRSLITALVLLIIAAGCTWLLNMRFQLDRNLDNIGRTEIDEHSLSIVDVDGYANIALLGVDSRDMSKDAMENANTDAIIIISINEESKKVNMISVYRDCYLQMGDTITYSKITEAHAYGGAEMTLKSLNRAMDLNIDKYVLFNFKMVSDLVNSVGGITVDVKESEIPELNKYTKQTANNIGQKEYKLVDTPGEQVLEGVQAVSYGRIRKGVGDDFKRTTRMRRVIKKVTAKLKGKSIGELMALMGDMVDQVETNLSNSDMIALAQRLATMKVSKSVGFPYKKTTGFVGEISYVFPIDLAANTSRLHQQMFGQEDYQVSDACQMISDVVRERSGV